MAQATLHTDRIALVPLADEHLEGEVALDADPEVMRYLANGRPRTSDQVEALLRERLAVAERAPGHGFWAGLVDGEFVGWWILEPPDPPDPVRAAGEAELGYRLVRRHWRQGLASEGSRELIRHGFEDLGLVRIHAQTMAVNVGSRATMSAVGLRHVRSYHEQWDDPIAGAEHGEVEYAITRDEWTAPTVPNGRQAAQPTVDG